MYNCKTISTRDRDPKIVDKRILMGEVYVSVNKEDGGVRLQNNFGKLILIAYDTLEDWSRVTLDPNNSSFHFRGLNIVVFRLRSEVAVCCLWNCEEFRILIIIDEEYNGRIDLEKDYEHRSYIEDYAQRGIVPFKFTKLAKEI